MRAADNALGAAPDCMSETQRLIWSEAIANSPIGVLEWCDLSLLAVWVVAADNRRQALSSLNQPGTKEEIEALLLRQIAAEQLEIMDQTAIELGFTPRSSVIWPQ